VAGIVAVLVAGAAWGIDRSLWLDEAYSLGAVHEPVRAAVVDRVSMLGFHLLLWPVTLISEAPWALRLVSLAASVAVVVLVMRTAAVDHGRRAAVTAGLVLATTWTVVSHAQEVRSYALGLLLTVAQWHLLRRWVRTGDRRALRGWTALALLVTVVHGLLILQVLAQALTVEAAKVDRARRLPVRGRAALAAVPPGILALTGAATLTPYQPPLTVSTATSLVESMVGPGRLGLPVLALAIVGAVVLVRRARGASDAIERFTALAPVAWAVVPLLGLAAVSVVTPKMMARYVFPSVAGTALLVGVAMTALPTRRIAAGAVAVVVALLAVHQIDGHRAGTGDWEAAAALVAEQARAGDAVVFPRANRRPPFEVAWDRRSSTPDLAVVNPDAPLGPSRWLRDDAPVAEVVAAATTHDRVWLVTEPFGSVDREQPVYDGITAAGYRCEDPAGFGMNITVTLCVAP
jgi:4-amino-4-deoxy-L-arabinose transferase-like glycosyltransferase